MTTDRAARFAYLRGLPRYLSELGELLGRTVTAADLVPLDESRSIRSQLECISREPMSRLRSSFQELRSARFRHLIDRLTALNPSDICVWTPASDACGLLRARPLQSLRWDFPFDINPEGILTFFTSDYADGMVLDFSREDDGSESLEIDLRGEHWAHAPREVSFGPQAPPASRATRGHWVAGSVKKGADGKPRLNPHGEPRLTNDKSRVGYDEE